MEKAKKGIKTENSETRMHARPDWVKKSIMSEELLCPDCFKVVGVESRYKLVCFLGKNRKGETVGRLTEHLGLKQPTITHHLNILKTVDAVSVRDEGRERIYTLNRGAHCFEECKIPY